MKKTKRTRQVTVSEKSLWTHVVAAAEPVKNPQGLASNFDFAANVNLSGHQLRRAKTPQSLPSGSRNLPDRSQKPITPDERAFAQRTPLEIGKVGETDGRTAQRLKRGKLSVDARLDLHGYTLLQARDRLLEFLSNSQSQGARCVLVVTGKGKRKSGHDMSGDDAHSYSGPQQHGKLRVSVPKWLNEPQFRPMVLSVSYAVQRDGGEGALYVLLRKKADRSVAQLSRPT